MVQLIRSKLFTESKKKNICWQIFYKVVFLEGFAKFRGKHQNTCVGVTFS